MRNAKSLEGMSVVAIADGKKLGSVDEMVLSSDGLHLAGFIMKSGGFLNQRELIVEARDVRSVGADAITVDAEEVARVSDEAAAEFRDGRASGRRLSGNKVVTESGTFVGTVSDFVIDEATFRVTSLVMSGSLLSSGDAVPTDRVISVGPDAIMIRNPEHTE